MNILKTSLLGIAVSLITTSAFAQAAWTVRNDWDAKTPEAGIAWRANSGLTWQQKYSEWMRNFKKIPREAGGWTFELTTPQGTTMKSPVVDCADTGMFLRVLFSAWYQLPFMFRAGNQNIGHWGVLDVKTGRAIGYVVGTLANRTVGGTDVQIPSIGGKLGNYLAKLLPPAMHRVGHLIVHLLSNAGSGNLAHEQNVYNIKAAALRAGDLAIERWQMQGIGHTVVIQKVEAAPNNKMIVEILQGWLPPRQAIWDGSVDAHALLSDHLFGGADCAEGSGPACVTYAKYGGGAKRWRVPKYVGGRWINSVSNTDLAAGIYIKGDNYAALGARTEEFESLIYLPGKDELLKALLKRIGDKRRSLAEKPSGCGARTGREETFLELYDLMKREFGVYDQKQIDAKYRKTIDYVFRPLAYTKSGTCCWNSSTAAMGASVVNQAIAAARSMGPACKAPAVFKKTNNRYDPYQTGAAGVQWAPYRNDENCAQGTQPSDTEDPWTATDYCTAKPWLNDAQPEVQ